MSPSEFEFRRNLCIYMYLFLVFLYKIRFKFSKDLQSCEGHWKFSITFHFNMNIFYACSRRTLINTSRPRVLQNRMGHIIVKYKMDGNLGGLLHDETAKEVELVCRNEINKEWGMHRVLYFFYHTCPYYHDCLVHSCEIRWAPTHPPSSPTFVSPSPLPQSPFFLSPPRRNILFSKHPGKSPT